MRHFCAIFIVFLISVKVFSWDDPYQTKGAPGYGELIEGFRRYQVKDFKKAYDLYTCSRDKGNFCAADFLAEFLLEGLGVEKDTISAIENVQYAARSGYAPSQWRLGDFFSNGIGVVQNDYAAFKWYEKSHIQGYERGTERIANCYLHGIGVLIDIPKGISILETLANKTDNIDFEVIVKSQRNLGAWYYSHNDIQKAIPWFLKAAENEDIVSCVALAQIYSEGIGIGTDFQKAHSYIANAQQISNRKKTNTAGLDFSLLLCDGKIYLKENNMKEASNIWSIINNSFPDMVRTSQDLFVITMKQTNKSEDLLSSAIVSDIDENVPENPMVSIPTFAVIIGCENYKDVANVPYAIHDGETFGKYCEKTLGIPKNNIKLIKDATLNNIKRQLNWIQQIINVYEGEVNIVVYYAGHGIPDEKNKSAYLLPVDGIGNDVSTGYSLDNLYSQLSDSRAKSVIILLDACFSGATREGGMLSSARSVAIKAKPNVPKGNMIVFSAAQGDETAYPYNEKGHGMFSYYLMKKLQNTKGDVSLGELSEYVINQVKKNSIIVNGKLQTPSVSVSSSMESVWKNKKLR